MGFSVNELVLVLIVACAAAVAIRRTGRRWIGVVPLVCLTAALFSPADIVSTLMIAVPNAVLMAVAVRLTERTPSREPAATA